ncbi:MAG: branched-chain amino acid ABC transporter permease [Actinobacteria bacterium]|nr:branched-chain amino acid ABC transporter permease [Actinomycetota bacterium]
MPVRPLVTRYEDDLRLFASRWQQAGLALGLVVVLVYPFVAGNRWLSIGNQALVAVVGSTALMILTGFTGQISLGHAAFLAVGAYTAGTLTTHLGLPFWLALPAAGLAAAALGLVVGPFALRLKGLYLAIVTLGMIFVVKHLLLSIPSLTRGVQGIGVPMNWWFVEGAEGGVAGAGTFGRPFAVGALRFDFNTQAYFLFLVVAAFTVWFAKNLQRSRTGRAMAAVRDRDIAASVVGVHLARVKVEAFAISSFFAGVAGAMFAFGQRFITVDPPFNLLMSVQYIAMIVLGGIGTVFGAVAGALAFTMLTPLAETVGRGLPLIGDLSSLERSTLLFSLLVGAFLLFEPLGLFGIWLRIKLYFLAWPFRY